jgi:acyl phosphate:glycerol-3-phosphate acyltransferase
MLTALLLIVFAYFMGSLPFGYWIGKVLKGIDIREHGSGSTGATNVWRCVGKVPGALVFLGDVGKGTVPVLVAIAVDNGGGFKDLTYVYPQLMPCVVALTALIAHSKSIFLNFSGGKSAATGLGTLFALNPIGGFLTFVTFVTMVFVGRIVSVASITAVALCGVYFWFLHAPPTYIGYCVVGFLYVTFRHKTNIKRLLNGTEPRIGQKPKDPPAATQPEMQVKRSPEDKGDLRPDSSAAT